jgi:hypothetical protein
MHKRIIVRIISIILALAGAWITWESTIWGLKAYPYLMQQLGSGISQEQIQVAYEAPVAALRAIGIVLLGVGLFHSLTLPAND